MSLPTDAAARKADATTLRSAQDRLRYATDTEWAEKKRAQAREWGRANAERNRARAAEWQRKNPEAAAQRKSQWHQNNLDTYRRAHLKKHYGLTVEQYGAMLHAQGGVCAICQSASASDGKRLCVDHCHESGKIRGLLCDRCNRAIGLLRDSPAVLLSAVAYIEHYKGRKAA